MGQVLCQLPPEPSSAREGFPGEGIPQTGAPAGREPWSRAWGDGAPDEDGGCCHLGLVLFNLSDELSLCVNVLEIQIFEKSKQFLPVRKLAHAF